MNTIRIAFIKYNGMLTGGTERWLQTLAGMLPKDEFVATYFYTGDEDPFRKAWLQDCGVTLVKIQADGKNAAGEWLNTDFFEKFDEAQFDIIQTAIAGPAEWPLPLLHKPVVQKIALDMGVDLHSNVYHTFFLSQWLRRQWLLKGGSVCSSSVIPFGVQPAVGEGNMREELHIPPTAVVAGFHQRVDDDIFSPVPLDAFAKVGGGNDYFLVMGGSPRYGAQAKALGLKNFIQLEHTGDSARISCFLNTLDIFAQGRRDGETFGYVFAEALMHKKPCIGHSAECNAHKETMGPGGLWATTNEEYARHLYALFTQPDTRAALARAGHDYATRLFDNEKGLAAIMQTYRKICRMPQCQRNALRLSRKFRSGLSRLGLYRLVRLGYRARRKILHLQGKFYSI